MKARLDIGGVQDLDVLWRWREEMHFGRTPESRSVGDVWHEPGVAQSVVPHGLGMPAVGQGCKRLMAASRRIQ